MEVPGHGVFAETNAILRLIGRLHGLHPDDPWDGARHDAVMDACEELRQRLSATSLLSDAGQKTAARMALASDYIPRWAKGIERLIGTGPFVGGAKPAVVDIKIYMIEKALSGGVYDDVPPHCPCPLRTPQGRGKRNSQSSRSPGLVFAEGLRWNRSKGMPNAVFRHQFATGTRRKLLYVTSTQREHDLTGAQSI